MATPIITRKCIQCGNKKVDKDTSFCDQRCFEIWYESHSAELIAELLVRILDDDGIQVGSENNANDGSSKP